MRSLSSFKLIKKETVEDIDFEHLAKHIIEANMDVNLASQNLIINTIKRYVIGDPEKVLEVMVDLGYIKEAPYIRNIFGVGEYRVKLF